MNTNIEEEIDKMLAMTPRHHLPKAIKALVEKVVEERLAEEKKKRQQKGSSFSSPKLPTRR